MSTMYQVSLSETAKVFFDDASAKLQRSLDRCFAQLQANPRFHPNIKALKGNLSGCYRYRVGDYRVVYRIEEQTQHVIVIAIAHRREVYE